MSVYLISSIIIYSLHYYSRRLIIAITTIYGKKNRDYLISTISREYFTNDFSLSFFFVLLFILPMNLQKWSILEFHNVRAINNIHKLCVQV